MKILEFNKGGETVEDVLRRALEECEEYEDICIVMQPRAPKDGLRWMGRNESTAERMIALLSGALFNFQCMMAGIKF